MPRGHGIIDVAADPGAERRERRRVVLRVGVPILGVVLMIAVILGIAVRLNDANRAGALKLADDVLLATDARIAEEVTSYFAIPTQALQEGQTIGEHAPAGEARRALIEKFSMGVMQHVPQITDFIGGDSEGDFMMFRRGDNGGIDTKLIDNTPKARKVIWIRRSAAGEETGREEDPTDIYDPRTRPWYTGALKADGTFWTDAYIFFTANEPGITASTRYTTPEGRKFVIGVDITLADLSKFLAGHDIGETGRAMIIADQGRVIAYPQPDRIVKRDASGLTAVRVDEIGDVAAAGAYDHFRVEGPSRQTITVDGQRYLASMTRLQTVGRDWSIMTVVPEKDFIGFVERNNDTALLMSLAIVALAAIGAGLLVRQGLRGDRAARLVRERSHAMAHMTEALDRVADEAELFEPAHPERFQTLAEVASEITGARHVNFWYLLADRNVLRCTDSFDSDSERHAAGFELHRDELPQFFDQVAAGTPIDVADAAHDPRTADVHRLTMAPLGSRSLCIVPMRHRGQVIGAIGLHDAAHMAGAREFLRLLASVASLRVADDAEGAPHQAAAKAVAVAEPDVAHSVSADLALRGLDIGQLGEAVYPRVAVLVLRIDDPGLEASTDDPKLFGGIVRAMQEIAEEQDIPYLKLVGYEVVGAAGFSPDDPAATSRIAGAAVAARNRLAALFEESGLEPCFQLGIDSGMAIGQALGGEHRIFNLWGQAVRTAQVMAASALPGSIQTSEAAYLQLRQGFLMRPRGTFYLPEAGASQTFILAGRL